MCRENDTPSDASDAAGDAPVGDGGEHSLHVRLACPQCGGSGMVPWQNLHHLFHCRRCVRWYRLEKSHLSPVPPPPKVFDVQVRSGFSEWRGDRYQGAHRWATVRVWLRSRLQSKRLACAAGIVCLAAAVGLTALLQTSRNAGVSAATERLPDALEERVHLWFDAWLARDEGRMLQLTAPSYDRQLRRWLLRNPAPDRQGDAATKCQVRLTSTAPRAHQSAEIVAEVEIGGMHGPPACLQFKQIWSQASGAWCFVPAFGGTPQGTKRVANR
jgi:hypothetical protein